MVKFISLFWQPVESAQASALVGWLFLRLIALIYFAAFASLAVQIDGLLGADGILPAKDYLQQAENLFGEGIQWQIPTVFWLGASDTALRGACWFGMFAALLVLAGRFVYLGLAACYVLYLSLVHVGQEFFSFQWDVFLLESGFLASFIPGGSLIVVWLFRFLLFRFMFMGGVVKLASGDPAWRNLTALHYHFETQPLPTPLAWYAHQLPDLLLQFLTGMVFFIELVVPFLVFLPRPYRLFAAVNFVVLQGSIILTGNYNFFNLLTLCLCVFLLDDSDIRRVRIGRWIPHGWQDSKPVTAIAHTAAAIVAVFVVSVCCTLLWMSNARQIPLQPFYAMAKFASNYALVNGYGPFAVMTTERREIIVEGSNDGRIWQAYEFQYKPGELAKPLSWNIPHQPRLDWQMWFAALGTAADNPWFMNFMEKLKQGSHAVLALLRHNPFPEYPPTYLRASVYLYRFATPSEHSLHGEIWQRHRIGNYLSYDQVH
jgi:hypothetical protein